MSGPTCIIPLGANGQYEAIVDQEDYAYLTQWRWGFKRSAWSCGGNIYARRNTTRDGKRVTLYMHIEILERRLERRKPTPDHTGDHKNKKSLDNRRDNLRWASKSTQSKNQKTRITAEELAAYHDERAAA
jgi:hypothetical protein